MEPVRYLRVIGRLRADNRMVLMPCYLTGHAGSIPGDPKSELTAELYRGDGGLLLRYGVALLAYDHQGQGSAAVAVRANVPFPADTSRVRFVRGGITIHEIAVSADKPSLQLTWRPPKTASAQVNVTWKAEHAGKLPMQFFVRYSHDGGKTWRRLSGRLEAPAYTVDLDLLPGGSKCALEVVATDGVNTTAARSAFFGVAVKSCIAAILAPEDGARFPAGAPICFRGQGFYLEEDAAELGRLAWTSSIDGKLGNGGALLTRSLSPGRHEIELAAGEGKRSGRARISLEVHLPKA